MAPRSCTYYQIIVTFTLIKKYTLNSVFSLNICDYHSDILINAKFKKKIPCHINKVTTAFILPLPPFRFMGF